MQALHDGADAHTLREAISFAHQPGHFTPDDVAILELAVTVLDLASPTGLPPLRYKGLRERFLPEHPFAGRVEHLNS